MIMPSQRPPLKIFSKVVCVVFLVGALLVLREETTIVTNANATDTSKAATTTTTKRVQQQSWAVFMALRKHPPSLRIFRSLLEWNLLMWGTAVSLSLWYKYVGRAMVTELLFSTTSGSSHTDYGDFGGTAHDAKARSSAYSGLNYRDPDEPEDASFQSEIMFANHDASFSHAETGVQDLDDAQFLEHKQHLRQKHQTQQPSPDKVLGDPIVSNTQTQRQSNKDNDDQESEPTDDKTTTTTIPYDAQPPLPQAPSVASVTSAALDMLLPILVALFLFTLCSTREWSYRVPQLTWVAPLIPLKLVLYLTVTQLLRPWPPRKHFFTVIGWTVSAPLFPVTFRDGFIGDIFTSTVRPLQDVAFTMCYILSGLQGYWSDGYDGFWDSVNENPHGLNDDDDAVSDMIETMTKAPSTTSELILSKLPPLETSWWLHTVLLPMCMVSPLWWRFLQNLRQTHDNRRRWPYLGNAFKYLLAAEVAMFGVFDPSKQQTWHWLGWFVIATLYQVWWDIWMDWQLLVPASSQSAISESDTTANSSGGWKLPSSFFGWRLRDKRLYPSKAFYWTILIVNVMLRFCWTLSFLPPRYLNQAGVLSDTFQHSDWSRALAPAIASAEIIRRTLWGWIRLENEAIKVAEEQENPTLPAPQMLELQFRRGYNPEEAFGDSLDGMSLEPMKMSGSVGVGGGLLQDGSHRWSFSKRQGVLPALWENWKTMENNNEIEILGELALWATVFATLGLIAAAHRMTL